MKIEILRFSSIDSGLVINDIKKIIPDWNGERLTRKLKMDEGDFTKKDNAIIKNIDNN